MYTCVPVCALWYVQVEIRGQLGVIYLHHVGPMTKLRSSGWAASAFIYYAILPTHY